MKAWERKYLAIAPFLLPVHQWVLGQLRKHTDGGRNTLLDVGGRKSHYTVGLDTVVVVTDLFRRSSVQKELRLGFGQVTLDHLQTNRSNILGVMVDDMTASSIASASIDIVVAVEVLEHVPDDDAFVGEIRRVLKPDGVFVMTTPNGDWVPNTNPDHVRHYRRSELTELLEASFQSVAVKHGIVGGFTHRWGLASWSLSSPFETARGMTSNLVNAWLSRVSSSPKCRHLLATASLPIRSGAQSAS